MDHEQAEKLLGALIFDDLDEQSKAGLLAYLETDADLRESLADQRMALKVTTDAVQSGSEPVLSDARLKRLETLSRSRRHPKVMMIARWAAVAACIAIAAGAFLIPSLYQVRLSSQLASEYSLKRNRDLATGVILADETDSLRRSTSSRGSGGPALSDIEDTSDGLLRGGEQVADSTWETKEAANRPLATGYAPARQTESLNLPKAKRTSTDDLGSFGNTSTTNNDKFYAYSDPVVPPTRQPSHEALSWGRAGGGRGEVLNERLLSEAEGSSKGQSVDLYAMNESKTRPELTGLIETQDGSEARLADLEPEDASLSKRLRGLKTDSGLGTEGWKAGRDSFGEELSRASSISGRLPEQDARRDLKLDVQGVPDASETEVAGVQHGFEVEGPASVKVPMPGDQPLAEGVYGGRMMGGSMGGAMGGGGMGGVQHRRAGLEEDFSRPSVEQDNHAAELAAGQAWNQEIQYNFALPGIEVVDTDFDRSDNSVLDWAEEVASLPQTQDGLALLGEAPVETRFGMPVEPEPGTKVALLGDVPLMGGLFRQSNEAAGTRGGIESSSKPVQPQKVLVQSKVIRVDEAALQDLGFQKERLLPQADMAVWSWKAGETGLDSVIDRLKQKEQLKVIATPSTMAQHGKEAQMSVMTEEYYMLTPPGELGNLGAVPQESEALEASLKMNLTPHVAGNQGITLDMDLEYTSSAPQGRRSGLPAQKQDVFSNEVSLKDGDSVIFLKPGKKLNRPEPTRELVIVTANLMQDKPVPPAARPAKASSEFTLPPASRFKMMPVNPWVLSEQDALSTFALDVDTASYALCRQYIQHGFLPPAGAVRMEEFVNAFDYAYPQRSEPTFSVMAEGTRSPFAEPGQALSLVKIAVKARTVGRDQRKAAHLVFVVDASASMGQADRLPLIQQGLSRLVEELGPQDRVSLVSCSDQARLLLDHVPARDRDVVTQAVQAIQPSGSTNLLSGLQLGYATARQRYVAGQINQVILCSDGVANVGATEAESVLEAVAEDRQQGIMLMCVGVGYGAYNDVLLEALANQGDGRYVFVDAADQVERVFVTPLASGLQTVAKDARIQVKFNPDVVRRYRLIGYENRDMKDEQFRDDTVDAGEVGSGQCATALYEIEFRNNHSGSGDLATVFVRYQDTDTQQFEEISRPLAQTQIKTRTVAQSPRFYLAASAARFAEWLRQSEHAKTTTLDQILSITDEISAALPLDQDIRQLADLIRQAEGLPRAP